MKSTQCLLKEILKPFFCCKFNNFDFEFVELSNVSSWVSSGVSNGESSSSLTDNIVDNWGGPMI